MKLGMLLIIISCIYLIISETNTSDKQYITKFVELFIKEEKSV